MPTASDILEELKKRAGNAIWCSELALSSGNRRCDLWVLKQHASKGYEATAYEIKVSRADFKRDTPEKQRDARLYSDYFFYAAPAGLIKPEEIPLWAGLIEYDPKRDFGPFSITLPAPRRCKDAPSWELMVSVIRNSGEVRRDTEILQEKIKLLERTIASQSRDLKELRGW